ncbi:hypothetical protein D1641_08350 [Colidextribacter sp. OB.20]|uniref:flagellar hook-associated protein FlgK n=1 Tax=Colidextribacter sp. OB.20 TaxID=2304568 RepID=UPI00136EEDB1|nr:flagellar basal body rod C-terminal domain-containing protein [Colidextribacter sp. OB.20]NBI10030.1 hypothetical protein [Colidextribacter sp. OB.20]
MAVIGTFGSFTAARLGIYASQSSLNVTGNNIANINTKGYTRQRMDLVSLHSWGTARYANKMSQDIGYGVMTNGVSQLRDPFIDIRYRDEQANVGKSETWLDCLNQLSHTLDEVGDGDDFGIVERQFNDFKLQLEQLLGAVGTEEYDTTTRTSAKVLTDLLNSYAKALEKVENNQIKQIKDDVTTVNTILTQIRDLNEEIREAGIHGGKALELRDERNVLIDDLSKYIKIDVSYDMEKLDEFNSVERLNISIAGSGNPPIRLICGIYGTQLGMGDTAPMRNPEYNFDDHNDPNNFITTNTDPVTGKPFEDANGNPITKTVPRPQYIAKIEDDGTIKYTNNPLTEAMAKAEAEKAGKPAPVEDPDNPWALEVNNAKTDDENEGDNRVWMNVQPLVTRKGYVFRDSEGEKSKMIELGDNALYGGLQARREFVTGEGEFSSATEIKYDKDATSTRGVPYYRYSLDALAQQFAKMFNDANRMDFDMVTKAYQLNAAGDAFVSKDGTAIQYTTANGTMANIDPAEFDDLAADIKELNELNEKLKDKDLSDTERKTIADRIKALEEKGEGIEARKEAAYEKMEILRQQGVLTPEYAYYDGGVMFSSSGDTNDPTGITAKNITISKAWSTGEVRILNTKKPDTVRKNEDGTETYVGHSTANDNIYHMVNLMTQKLDYLPKNTVADAAQDKRYFNGSFQERFADMNVTLAVDRQTTTTLYNSYSIKSLSLENDRESVAGVDLNDEATNMMVFQKSYSAACQLMTTLDSMLDKLINGTIRS